MKKNFIILGIVALIAFVGICVWVILQILSSVNTEINFDVESLRWSIIGAIGGWVGSIFSVIALIVSLVALWFPQRVKIKVSFRCGIMLNSIAGNSMYTYIITVKNLSVRPVTINNVYLNFGGKKQGDIFVGVLNKDSLLEYFTPIFPKRLEQGESFEYYLLKDRLQKALENYGKKTSLGTPLSIRVDEVTKGVRYYKTKWTLKSFIDK